MGLLSLTFRSEAQQSDDATATHCLLLPLDPVRRSQQAALVVEGEVLSADGFWDTPHQHIYTAHRLRVFTAFKGGASSEITVVTEGGNVGEDWQELSNTLRLTIGEQGIFFLRQAVWPGLPPAAAPAWAVYGSQQGFIRFDLVTLTAAEPFRTYPAIDKGFYATISAQTGQAPRNLAPNQALNEARQRNTRASAAAAKGQAPIIGALLPLTITAGTGSVLTISGSGFGSPQGNGFVEFRNANDGGKTFVRPQPADYVSWSDAQIRVRVPSFGTAGEPAGTGVVRVNTTELLQATSTEMVTIPYALANVQERNSKLVVRPRHSNQDASGGLTFQMEAGFAANANAAGILQRDLLDVWRCQTGVNWRLGPNRTGRGAADDEINSVGFDSGSELPANVLGRTTSYYRGCFGPRGQLEFHVKEIDLQFDDGVNFLFTAGIPAPGQFDFESVMIHELGHAQQLGHVILTRAVMHFGLASRQVKQVLSPDDISGARFVLRTRSFVAAACGPAAMLPAPLATQLVRRVGSGAEIVWTTREECLVQEYVVERGADTSRWQLVAALPAGNGTGTYRFVDPRPLPGLSYYRLRVRRPDGTLDPAVPLATTDEAAANDQLVVFPNPVRGGLLQLQFPASATGTLSVFLYDALGRYYRGQGVEIAAGLNIRSLNVDALHPGWYLLRWRDQAGKTGTTRFIKLAP
ncbi:hypothetical protein GCM10022408_12770 [Hymenobacter fastidiosus]|uniref:T9SS type A sorting domain-containing protein n=1 Tax=Hymenobacter fastidiosus TaxID=486264 RepID=A0ABP7RVB9_9BACT